jgi:hypothetical protein
VTVWLTASSECCLPQKSSTPRTDLDDRSEPELLQVLEDWHNCLEVLLDDRPGAIEIDQARPIELLLDVVIIRGGVSMPKSGDLCQCIGEERRP